MPLYTQTLVTSLVMTANNFIVHGLTHAGTSRVPHFVVVNPTTASAAAFAVSWDATSINVFPVGVNVVSVTANVFVKRSHTIEDGVI